VRDQTSKEITMKRSLLIAVFAALAFTTVTSLAAAEGKKKFPMPAQEFKQKVEGNRAKAKAKLEERIKAKNVDPEKAKIMRARFESASAKVTQAVSKVAADGSVTREEAQDVQTAARQAKREAAQEAKRAAREAAKQKRDKKRGEGKKHSADSKKNAGADSKKDAGAGKTGEEKH
jgi:colicin import membrane protein